MGNWAWLAAWLAGSALSAGIGAYSGIRVAQRGHARRLDRKMRTWLDQGMETWGDPGTRP